MATQMPANVAETFAAIPRAQCVLVEMGHAYGKAKFASNCPLTGIGIQPGTPIRKLEFWTRDGRHFNAHVASRSAEAMQFVYTGDVTISTWVAWTPNWLDNLNLAALQPGTRVEVLKPGSFEVNTTSWTLEEFGGKRQWMQKGSRSSDAQLTASLKRVKKAIAYRIG